MLFSLFFDQKLEDPHSVFVVSAAFLVFVANCSIEFQLPLNVKLSLKQKTFLDVPGFVVLAVHDQQQLTNPVDLFLFDLLFWYGFEESGVVFLEEAVADAETLLFNGYLFLEKLIGDMFDFLELNLSDKLAMNNSGILDN